MRARFSYVFLEALLVFLSAREVSAAACCSGGASLPTMILNDDRWSARFQTSSSFVVGDADGSSEATFRKDAFDERVFSFVPSLAYRFGDQWQMGARLPIKQRDLGAQSASGLGDFAAHISYEPFPPYTYSQWAPRFFIVGGLSIPTGTATYDTNRFLLDSFGTGFWSPSVGVVIARTFVRFDYFLSSEAKYQFSRSFKNESVDPGWILSGKAGAGYSVSAYRLGLSLGPSYEEAKRLKRARQQSPSKLIWDAAADFSATLSDTWSASLSYSDQTLMGPAQNVSLERSVGLGVAYHGL